jgi:hypothetical protein
MKVGATTAADRLRGLSIKSTGFRQYDESGDIFVEAFWRLPTSDETYPEPRSHLSVTAVALTDVFVIDF